MLFLSEESYRYELWSNLHCEWSVAESSGFSRVNNSSGVILWRAEYRTGKIFYLLIWKAATLENFTKVISICWDNNFKTIQITKSLGILINFSMTPVKLWKTLLQILNLFEMLLIDMTKNFWIMNYWWMLALAYCSMDIIWSYYALDIVGIIYNRQSYLLFCKKIRK